MQVLDQEMITASQQTLLKSLTSTIPRLVSLRQTQSNTIYNYKPSYYDIGLNLTDPMFSGTYRDSQHHRNDINEMLLRAKLFNVKKALVTGSSVEESEKSIELAKFYNELNKLYKNNIDENIENLTKQLESQLDISSKEKDHYQPYPILKTTAGVHPCTVLEFESNPNVSPEDHLMKLRNLIKNNLNTIQAFGEIGLDYDRLHYTPKEKQIFYFELQLKLACEFDLPLFLHMRNAFNDFISILKPFVEGTRNDGLILKNKKLCIHSFTGEPEEMFHLLNTFNGDGIKTAKSWISLNGCSLREEIGLNVAKVIPTDRLLIETDSPWCEVKRTSASYEYLKKCPNVFYPFEYVTDLTSLNPIEVSKSNQNVSVDDDSLENSTSKSQQKPEQTQKQTQKQKQNQNQNQNQNQKQNQKSTKDSIQFNEYIPIPIVKSKKFDEFISNPHNENKYLSPLIKSRNEPCLVGQVGQIISGVKKMDEQELIEVCWKNSLEVFG